MAKRLMPQVLVLRENLKCPRAELHHFWAKIEQHGWLDCETQCIVVQIGPSSACELVQKTAASLLDFLHERCPEQELNLIDGNAMLDSTRQRWGDRVVRPPHLSEERIILTSPCFPDGVSAPTLWLQPLFLITLCSLEPDALGRLSGFLRAQAAILPRNTLEAHLYYDEMIYESHRLAASDLGIVCGPVSRQHPQATAFWAASPNDIALELTLARAAGLQPQDLPHLRFLKRHEIIPYDHVGLEGEWPQLEGYASPVWKVWTARLWWGAVRKVWAVLSFADTTRDNLRRLAPYLRRRVSWGEDF